MMEQILRPPTLPRLPESLATSFVPRTPTSTRLTGILIDDVARQTLQSPRMPVPSPRMLVDVESSNQTELVQLDSEKV